MNSADNQLPRAGDVVGGKYRVESVIGAGGMGVVLAAMDTSLGRRVAIKFMMPHKADRDGAAARFAREARAAASIQSEHVVRVFEVSTLPTGASYIVMEHLAGADLGQILTSRGTLPIQEAVDDLLQACEALGEAHKLGIVHRDLKPQNLFVTQRNDGSPCVKVLDFGISKAADGDAPSLTATDTVMGTPLYMSPEQVRSLKNVDQRSDIWSLGAILFELLTSAPVFEAQTMTALCAAIAMDPPTPLRTKRPDAPAELEAVILRCLHKDPSGRFQDVAALADALASFASERGRQSASRVAQIVRTGGGQAPPPQRSSYVPISQAVTANPGSSASTQLPGSDPSLPMPISHLSIPYSSQSAPSMAMPPSSHPGVASTQTGVPSTVGMGSNYPPAPTLAQTNEQQPWTPQRTTQQTWQHTGGQPMSAPPPPAARGSNTLVVVMLGVVAAVILLAVVVGGGIFFVARRSAAADAEATAASAAAAPLVSAQPVPGAVASTAPTAVAAGPGAGAGAGPKKSSVADAGAVAVAAKASATPASSAGAKSKADDELEREKRSVAGQCGLMQSILRTNEPKNNQAAKQVRTQICVQSFGPQGHTCERAVCRSACSMLQDQQCLSQLDSADRSFPPKF